MSETFQPVSILLSLVVPAMGVAAFPGTRAALDRLRLRLDGMSTAALSLAVALLWVQAGAMLGGFTHQLQRWPAAIWLASGVGLSLAAGRKHLRPPAPGVAGIRLPLLFAACVLALLLLEATVPPWFADDLVYHLSLPRLFAIAHGYVQPDDNIFKAFPLGWESILSFLFVFGDSPDQFPPFNPRLVTVWVGVGAACATAGLARSLGASRTAAAWAGALLLCVPTFAEFTTLCYVESYLILLSTLALIFVLRVLDGEEQSLVPAAILAGASASVKYPGLGVCVGLTLLLLTGRREGRERRLLEFIAVGAVVGSPFYLRNWIERGNPFFPTLYDLFGGRGWDSWRAANYAGILSHYGEGHTGWTDWFLLPLRLLVANDPKSGFEASLGPAVCGGAVAAMLLLSSRARSRLFVRPSPAITVGSFALFWFFFWACTTQQGRMFLPAIPALVALCVVALDGLVRWRPLPGIALAAGLVLTTVGFAIPVGLKQWRYQETTRWVTRQLDVAELLSSMLPDTWPIEQALEGVVPPTGRVWLVWMHDYTYYLRRPWIEDQIFEDYRFAELLDASPSPADFAHALVHQGVTHVLVNHSFFLSDGSADVTEGRTGRLRVRFGEVLRAQVLTPVLERRDVTLYAVRPSG